MEAIQKNDLLLKRANMLFPESKTDLEAVNKFANHLFNKAKRFEGKESLKCAFEEVSRNYHMVNELRKEIIKNNEVLDEQTNNIN